MDPKQLKALLEHCLDKSVPLIYASSAAVYGASTTFREDDAMGPVLGMADIPLGLIDQGNLQEGFATTDL